MISKSSGLVREFSVYSVDSGIPILSTDESRYGIFVGANHRSGNQFRSRMNISPVGLAKLPVLVYLRVPIALIVSSPCAPY